MTDCLAELAPPQDGANAHDLAKLREMGDGEWEEYVLHCMDMALKVMEFVTIDEDDEDNEDNEGDVEQQRRTVLQWVLDCHLGAAYFHAYNKDDFVEEFK